MASKRRPTTPTTTSAVKKTSRSSKATGTASTTITGKKAVAASTTTRGTKRKLEVEAEAEAEEKVETVEPRLVIRQDGDEDIVSVVKIVETKTTTKGTPAKRVKTETVRTPAKRTPAKRVKVEVEEKGDAEVNGTPKKPATTKAIPTPAKTRTGTLDAFLAGAQTPKKTPKKQSGTLDDFVLRTPAAAKKKTPVEETKMPKKSSGNLDDFVTRTPAAAPTPVKGSKTPLKPSGKPKGFAKKPPTSSPSKPRARNYDADTEDLPESLSGLIRFHASLLTALLLHKAQYNSGVFPSFAAMKPHIERLTSKRVSLEDIRKIVFLSHYNLPSSQSDGGGLHLIDYGAGKTVIKFTETSSTKLIHSESLKSQFSHQVREFHTHMDADATVPLAQIQEHLHRTTINTVLHGKSQRLIKELKAVPKKNTVTFTAKKAAASTRSSGLLERIRAKAAAADKPPTPEELLRRAAGDRMGEVREILRGCRAKGGSLGLRAAVEKVRESVKNPIGADEAELAVKLVAEMETWCDVRTSGGVGAVVFGCWEGEGSFA